MLERVSAQPRHLVKDFKLLTDIVASYRLQITDYRLLTTDYKICNILITDYRLFKKGSALVNIWSGTLSCALNQFKKKRSLVCKKIRSLNLSDFFLS